MSKWAHKFIIVESWRKNGSLMRCANCVCVEGIGYCSILWLWVNWFFFSFSLHCRRRSSASMRVVIVSRGSLSIFQLISSTAEMGLFCSPMRKTSFNSRAFHVHVVRLEFVMCAPRDIIDNCVSFRFTTFLYIYLFLFAARNRECWCKHLQWKFLAVRFEYSLFFSFI